MPLKSNYKECYRILLLSPDSDWNSLRKAYKLQIKQWHPDRFPEGTAKNQAANEKIKLINVAYNELLKYHKKNGQLPAIDTAPVQTPVEAAPTTYTESKRTSNNEQTFDKKPTTPTTEEKRSGTNYRVLITIILVTSSLIFFSLVETPDNDEQIKGDGNRISYINNKPVIPAIQKNKIDLIEKKTLSQTDTLNNNSFSAPIDRPSTRYITIGSKMVDILEIQGTPDKIVDDIWYYGESEIRLIDGRVSSWKRTPGSPIKTSIIAK